MDNQLNNTPHSISITDRSLVALSGVTDVGGFDETAVVLETAYGRLTIKGDNLQVTELSLDKGIVNIEGNVSGIEYYESRKKQGSLFARLMG